jgi:hypothetical protein
MGSAFYLWLVEIEDALLRMIEGVFRFITEGLWEWVCHFVVDTLGPVTVRLARVTGLACLWLFIVFGPLMVGFRFGLPGWWGFVCVVWFGLAIIGSIWGLRRLVKRATASTAGSRMAALKGFASRKMLRKLSRMNAGQNPAAKQ